MHTHRQADTEKGREMEREIDKEKKGERREWEGEDGEKREEKKLIFWKCNIHLSPLSF